MARLILSLALFGCTLTAANGQAVWSASASDLAVPPFGPAEVQTLARDSGVWGLGQWQALLHYQGYGAGEAASTIDGGDFFLSPDGAVDPRAEGEATLNALLTAAADNGDESVQCLYPARYQFLRTVLPPAVLPAERECPALTRWLEGFRPAGATLVFAEAYLNNPASMFGHTFLRIDAKGLAPSAPLLSSSIGYAAVTDDHQGLLYAVKGIFGGYKGMFNAWNYHEQVRMYGGIEHRDIWEYPLDLSQEETLFLLYHVWELRRAEFDYYFFDENCSFQLLALLETVRPGLLPTTGFRYWTLPLDTVRVVRHRLGGGIDPVYRPSRRTLLDLQVRHSDRYRVRLAKRLAAGETNLTDVGYTELSDCSRAAVADLAISYLLYDQADRAESESGPDQENPRLMELMLARSLSTCLPAQPVVESSASAPDQGHLPARITTAAGWESTDRTYLQLGIRPLLHDLNDPPAGYSQGAQLQALAAAFRWYPASSRFSLENLTILDIVSLPASSPLFTPFSWKVHGSLNRMRFAENSRALVLRAEVGGGLTYAIGDSLAIHGLVEATLLGSDHFRDWLELGPGFNIGLRWSPVRDWTTAMEVQANWFMLDQGVATHEVRVTQSWSPVDNQAIQLVLSRSREFTDPVTTIAMQWHYYF